MIWTGWTEFPIEIRDADLRPRGAEAEWRSGCHLGSIIHKLKVAMGQNVGDIPGDQLLVRMQEGFLWEVALEYVTAGMTVDGALELAFKRYMVELRKGVSKQVQVEMDGIRMTPDGFDSVAGRLESYKCTRRSLGGAKSQEEFVTNFWEWQMQEMSYCLAVGVDSVRWVVLWQGGDYKRGAGTGPRVMESTATWSVEELKENWRVVLKHAGMEVASPKVEV